MRVPRSCGVVHSTLPLFVPSTRADADSPFIEGCVDIGGSCLHEIREVLDRLLRVLLELIVEVERQ